LTNHDAISQTAAVAVVAVVIIAAIAGVWLMQSSEQEAQRAMTISTTTSLYDTGLLEDVIGPAFKNSTGIELHFIAKGTGAAIQDAKNGVADAILVHARSSEQAFLQDGYGVDRKIIAYNFFAIVGPADDPAGIRNMTPTQALQTIVSEGRNNTGANETLWASRDDGSGTNSKEKDLWKAAGYTYDGVKNESWFRSTGSGMGDTLNYCNNVGAYTLADMGTYLKYEKDGLISLEVLVEDGAELINIYSIITINPEKIPDKDFEGAQLLTRWLVSDEGQQLIGNYGVAEYGRPLFYPAVSILEQGNGTMYNLLMTYGFINGTECPMAYQSMPFFGAS
jgi:tungstate transport system substrate-binding protein